MHYRNGREAKVGDRVIGRTYNQKDLVSGTLVSLTPGPDTCSAKVGFLELQPLDGVTVPMVTPVAVQGTENHGASGPVAATVYREDYTEASNLIHADDACWVDSAGGAIVLRVSEPTPA